MPRLRRRPAGLARAAQVHPSSEVGDHYRGRGDSALSAVRVFRGRDSPARCPEPNDRRRGHPEASAAFRTGIRVSSVATGDVGRSLAKTIGVVHESISRWENGVLPVSSPVDRLMRTMVALTISGEKFPLEALSHIEGDAGPLKLVVTVDSKGSWRRAA